VNNEWSIAPSAGGTGLQRWSPVAAIGGLITSGNGATFARGNHQYFTSARRAPCRTRSSTSRSTALKRSTSPVSEYEQQHSTRSPDPFGARRAPRARRHLGALRRRAGPVTVAWRSASWAASSRRARPPRASSPTPCHRGLPVPTLSRRPVAFIAFEFSGDRPRGIDAVRRSS
jgi:hypothetical protein